MGLLLRIVGVKDGRCCGCRYSRSVLTDSGPVRDFGSARGRSYNVTCHYIVAGD